MPPYLTTLHKSSFWVGLVGALLVYLAHALNINVSNGQLTDFSVILVGLIGSIAVAVHGHASKPTPPSGGK